MMSYSRISCSASFLYGPRCRTPDPSLHYHSLTPPRFVIQYTIMQLFLLLLFPPIHLMKNMRSSERIWHGTNWWICERVRFTLSVTDYYLFLISSSSNGSFHSQYPVSLRSFVKESIFQAHIHTLQARKNIQNFKDNQIQKSEINIHGTPRKVKSNPNCLHNDKREREREWERKTDKEKER